MGASALSLGEFLPGWELGGRFGVVRSGGDLLLATAPEAQSAAVKKPACSQDSPLFPIF